MKKKDLGIYIGLVISGAFLVGIQPLLKDIGLNLLFRYRDTSSSMWFVVLLFVLSTIFFGVFIALAFSRFNFQEDRKVIDLKQERIAIQEKIRKNTSSNIIEIIQLNLNQLDEYYTINKNQARNSFYTSLFLIFLGFFTILFTVVLFLSNPELDISMPIISGISGVLLQFIGGASFFIYNKTLEQVNRFYNNLVKTQDTMLAVELCNQVDDGDKKMQLMQTVVVDLLRRSSLYTSELVKLNSQENHEITRTTEADSAIEKTS